MHKVIARFFISSNTCLVFRIELWIFEFWLIFFQKLISLELQPTVKNNKLELIVINAVFVWIMTERIHETLLMYLVTLEYNAFYPRSIKYSGPHLRSFQVKASSVCSATIYRKWKKPSICPLQLQAMQRFVNGMKWPDSLACCTASIKHLVTRSWSWLGQTEYWWVFDTWFTSLAP